MKNYCLVPVVASSISISHVSKSKHSTDKISNTEGFLTIWKSSLGVGAYSLPYLFYLSSPVFGFLMFTSIVIVASYTTLIMIDCHDAIIKHRNKIHPNNHNHTALGYPYIAEYFLGSFGYYISFGSLFLGLWGPLIAYNIFIKQNLFQFVLQNPLIFPHENDNKFDDYYIVIALIPILLLFLFLKNMKHLFIINLLGILSLLFVTVIMLMDTFSLTDIWTINNLNNTFLRLPTINSLILSFGLASFCMEGLITTAIPIYESLEHAQYSNYKMMLAKAMTCFIISYSLFAFLGVLTYHKPLDSILLNFDTNILLYDIIAYCCCLSVLLTYPMVNYALYTMIEQTEFSMKYINTSTLRIYMFRTILILSTVFIAMFVPEYGAFLSFVGCIGNACAIFWIPSACYLMRYHNGFGIVWLNYLICKSCSNEDKKCSETNLYLMNSKVLYKIDNNDACGKYMAFSILLIGFVSSVVGMYVSVKQQISAK